MKMKMKNVRSSLKVWLGREEGAVKAGFLLKDIKLKGRRSIENLK